MDIPTKFSAVYEASKAVELKAAEWSAAHPLGTTAAEAMESLALSREVEDYLDSELEKLTDSDIKELTGFCLFGRDYEGGISGARAALQESMNMRPKRRSGENKTKAT